METRTERPGIYLMNFLPTEYKDLTYKKVKYQSKEFNDFIDKFYPKFNITK